MKAVIYHPSLVLVLLSSIASEAQDAGWSRQGTENGKTLIMYQPQVYNWKDFRKLDWRMAHSLTLVDKAADESVVVALIVRHDLPIEFQRIIFKVLILFAKL